MLLKTLGLTAILSFSGISVAYPCTKIGCSNTISLGLWFKPEAVNPLWRIRDKKSTIFDECKLFQKLPPSEAFASPAMFKMRGRIDIDFSSSRIGEIEGLIFETFESCGGKSKRLTVGKIERNSKQDHYPNGKNCGPVCTSERVYIHFK